MTAIINTANHEFVRLTDNRLRILVLTFLSFAIMC